MLTRQVERKPLIWCRISWKQEALSSLYSCAFSKFLCHQWNKQNADQCMPTTSLYYCKLFPIFTSLHALLTITVVLGNLPLRHWKTIEILQIVRFQSLNFTSKPKGYLLQTTKMWEKLIVLKRRRKKATKPKEEVNFLSLKRAKFVKMTIF